MSLGLEIAQMNFYNQMKSAKLTECEIYEVCECIRDIESEMNLYSRYPIDSDTQPEVSEIKENLKSIKKEMPKRTNTDILFGIYSLFFIKNILFASFLFNAWSLSKEEETTNPGTASNTRGYVVIDY